MIGEIPENIGSKLGSMKPENEEQTVEDTPIENSSKEDEKIVTSKKDDVKDSQIIAKPYLSKKKISKLPKKRIKTSKKEETENTQKIEKKNSSSQTDEHPKIEVKKATLVRSKKIIAKQKSKSKTEKSNQPEEVIKNFTQENPQKPKSFLVKIGTESKNPSNENKKVPYSEELKQREVNAKQERIDYVKNLKSSTSNFLEELKRQREEREKEMEKLRLELRANLKSQVNEIKEQTREITGRK